MVVFDGSRPIKIRVTPHREMALCCIKILLLWQMMNEVAAPVINALGKSDRGYARKD